MTTSASWEGGGGRAPRSRCLCRRFGFEFVEVSSVDVGDEFRRRFEGVVKTLEGERKKVATRAVAQLLAISRRRENEHHQQERRREEGSRDRACLTRQMISRVIHTSFCSSWDLSCSVRCVHPTCVSMCRYVPGLWE